MNRSSYYAPGGGLPPQTQLLTDRAVVTTAYTVIPKGVLSDIVLSVLPEWRGARCWILNRPVPGGATTFAQYLIEIEPGGGSDEPEPQDEVESFVFVLSGELDLALEGERHLLAPGGFAFLPPGSSWQLHNRAGESASFQWIRKRYEPVQGLVPQAVVGNEQNLQPSPMPGTEGRWSTTRMLDPEDLAYDMHVNVVTFEPGASIPFAETHVMEHGLYMLEGKAVYHLNTDWVEVEAGDYLSLRAFCPQACYAGGPGRFRYLLYKDVNRQIRLGS